MIGGEEISALLVTGCEKSILNKQLHYKLRLLGLNCLELPTQHLKLVSTFNDRSKGIKKQALLEIQICDSTVDQVVLLSPHLLTDSILGLDFLIDHAAEISSPGKKVSLKINEKYCRLEFQGAREAGRQKIAETPFKEQVRNYAPRSTVPCATAQVSADSNKSRSTHLEYTPAATGYKLGKFSDGDAHTSVHQGDCLLIDDKLPHCEGACDVTDLPAKFDAASERVKCGCDDALGWNKEGQMADVIDDFQCVKAMLDNLDKEDANADDARLCSTVSYFEPNYANMSQKSVANLNSSDDRMITADQLRAKVCEKHILSPQHQTGTKCSIA
jgi:hypothetical protein